MAIAKWASPSTRSSNLAGTAFNTLANGSISSLITYDNSTNRNLYTTVTVKLGSITPSTGGSVTLRVYSADGTDVPDSNGSAFDSYTVALTTGASAKVVIIPLVRLYPFSCRLQLQNNAGVSLAGSGNELYCTDFNEDVS
jgi:hypothetical protein